MTIGTRLAEIRARVEAATPGLWKFEHEGHSSCGEPTCCSEDWDNRIWANGAVLLEDYQLTDADAEFIAASRTDIPALLAAVEAVKKRADRWTSLDRPEGDDFHGGFNAGVKFAADHILRDITTALEGNRG